jgi:hypothetical protein
MTEKEMCNAEVASITAAAMPAGDADISATGLDGQQGLGSVRQRVFAFSTSTAPRAELAGAC